MLTDDAARDAAAETEAVFVAALSAFRDVPGIRVHDDGDLVRTMAPGRPHVFLNAVVRVALEPATLEARVREVEDGYRREGLPVAWWLSTVSRPADITRRLERLGLRRVDEDTGMVVDLADRPATTERQADAPSEGVRVAEVADDSDLAVWIDVIARSYGWRDPPRARDMEALYDPVSAPAAGRRQLLARIGGEGVGCASLFEADGQAWVTNVGTVPEARGRGVGAAVTSACLDLAVARGHARAWLAASAMGRPLYERLGFVSTGPLLAYRSPAGSP